MYNWTISNVLHEIIHQIFFIVSSRECKAKKMLPDGIIQLTLIISNTDIPKYPFTSKNIQSTLVISNLKGPSETLRDIRTSTYQISELRKIQIAQPNLTNEYVSRLL